MIPHDFIQTLLARVDIVEIVDRFVPLKKAGTNYAACCPFHSEKTPSFTVSPTKQFYHCFGCGAHGTAIGFLMEYGGKTFPDAVETLARDAGLAVPRIERKGERERREEATDLTALLLTAAKFYRAALRDSPRAIAYLKARGLTGAIAVRYGIGYAPDGWQSLERAFENYTEPALEAAGLVINGDGGRRYDRFRDRVMFPIHDVRGHVVGFGGRVLDKGEPKYLNSPETAVFSKGRELYGLFQARGAVRAAGKVVVVEGYMDVLALAQHGIEYAVATLGTATTPVQAQKLFHLTDTVVFCFDGDAAGRRAAWRALENTLPVIADGKDARFLFLPDGEDPDDYVRKRGKAAFEVALGQAVPLSEFLLAALAAQHPPASAEGRAAWLAAARPLVAQVHAPFLAALIQRQLAATVGLAEDELRKLFDAPSGSNRPSQDRGRDHRSGPARALGRRAPSLARALIAAILVRPDVAATLALPQPSDTTPEAAALRALATFCEQHEGTLTTAGLMQAFSGTMHDELLAGVLAAVTDHGLTPELAEAQLRDGVERWWLQAHRSGSVDAAAASFGPVSAEEAERRRQLDVVRKAVAESERGSGFAR